MKSIEQIIELSSNPYYAFSPEELKRLNDFLAKKSDTQAPAKKNGKNSEKNIPATVINKNRVQKEVGAIPTINNVAERQEEAFATEEAIHSDAVYTSPDAS